MKLYRPTRPPTGAASHLANDCDAAGQCALGFLTFGLSMIESFFQNLNEEDVGYLLISGQATVLYGAATFSEDIDLWIDPTPDNRDRFLAILQSCQARYYKLTPPFTVEHLQQGHGFHFLLQSRAGEEVFLDVMGVPPRVGPFEQAKRSAQWKESDWGRLLTVGIRDLVELKKTQRLEDYPIISRLALALLEQPTSALTAADFRWALENIFTLTELKSFADRLHPDVPQSSWDIPNAARTIIDLYRGGNEPDEGLEQDVSDWMQDRMRQLQNADRQYWRRIVAELRHLRSTGSLMTEGAPV